MKSVATRRFWARLHALPPDIQDLAVKNYYLWLRSPNHPSLHFRRLKGSANRFSIRVGAHYRALAESESGTVTWVWIGTHAEYDQLVRAV
jgi:hypothetical protein